MQQKTIMLHSQLYSFYLFGHPVLCMDVSKILFIVLYRYISSNWKLDLNNGTNKELNNLSLYKRNRTFLNVASPTLVDLTFARPSGQIFSKFLPISPLIYSNFVNYIYNSSHFFKSQQFSLAIFSMFYVKPRKRHFMIFISLNLSIYY